MVIELAVSGPRVELPAVRVVAKRLVDDAVVEKKLVVVAEVPVAVVHLRVWIVVEALASNPPVIVMRSEVESPRVVWSWTVRFPAMVVAP